MTDREGEKIMTIIEDVPVYDEDGNVISEYDLDVGYLVDYWDASDGEMRLVKYVYHRHTDETRAAERRATIDAGAADFFADGGKEKMERAIEEAAASGGTDPQLQAIARMQVATMDLTEATSTDCAGFRDYWPEWQPDMKYKYQQPLRHKGLYYRASKALTSSAIYPPDTAGESEYYPVEIAPDGIIVYRTCHGQYDQVQAGETRHYPDAEGPVYRAKVDTAYDPDTVPGNWKLVEDADAE